MTASPPTAKGRATRERIVRTAAEMVAEEGVAALTLDRVGARAPASRSQLYHYFADKDALVLAIVEETCDAVLGAQTELFAQLDSWEGIARWFQALVELQRQRHARGGCPIGSLAGQLAERDPQARAAIADGLDRWESHLRKGLIRMRRGGELTSDADPSALATATMAMLQGGLLLTQVRRDPEQLRTALDAAWELLRAARARHDGPATGSGPEGAHAEDS
ncbi:MAG TPA: TetR/AcrR family transcriptional regulator [Solirubrobacteraceae bacterium]|jgi:AcrR family transcriptional regulator|nr:TetR/AcrR family transcriptional regulator [Solirubrobacteraceae bacterium]